MLKSSWGGGEAREGRERECVCLISLFQAGKTLISCKAKGGAGGLGAKGLGLKGFKF